MPLAGAGLHPTPLRRRASCPQLKRDPLGGWTRLGADFETNRPMSDVSSLRIQQALTLVALLATFSRLVTVEVIRAEHGVLDPRRTLRIAFLWAAISTVSLVPSVAVLVWSLTRNSDPILNPTPLDSPVGAFSVFFGLLLGLGSATAAGRLALLARDQWRRLERSREASRLTRA